MKTCHQHGNDGRKRIEKERWQKMTKSLCWLSISEQRQTMGIQFPWCVRDLCLCLSCIGMSSPTYAMTQTTDNGGKTSTSASSSEPSSSGSLTASSLSTPLVSGMPTNRHGVDMKTISVIAGVGGAGLLLILTAFIIVIVLLTRRSVPFTHAANLYFKIRRWIRHVGEFVWPGAWLTVVGWTDGLTGGLSRNRTKRDCGLYNQLITHIIKYTDAEWQVNRYLQLPSFSLFSSEVKSRLLNTGPGGLWHAAYLIRQ